MEKAWKPEMFEHYYHRQQICVCLGEKSLDSALCDGCRQHLRDTQPALLHIIENGTGDPLLQAMSEFESLVREAK